MIKITKNNSFSNILKNSMKDENNLFKNIIFPIKKTLFFNEKTGQLLINFNTQKEFNPYITALYFDQKILLNDAKTHLNNKREAIDYINHFLNNIYRMQLNPFLIIYHKYCMVDIDDNILHILPYLGKYMSFSLFYELFSSQFNFTEIIAFRINSTNLQIKMINNFIDFILQNHQKIEPKLLNYFFYFIISEIILDYNQGNLITYIDKNKIELLKIIVKNEADKNFNEFKKQLLSQLFKMKMNYYDKINYDKINRSIFKNSFFHKGSQNKFRRSFVKRMNDNDVIKIIFNHALTRKDLKEICSCIK